MPRLDRGFNQHRWSEINARKAIGKLSLSTGIPSEPRVASFPSVQVIAPIQMIAKTMNQVDMNAMLDTFSESKIRASESISKKCVIAQWRSQHPDWSLSEVEIPEESNSTHKTLGNTARPARRAIPLPSNSRIIRTQADALKRQQYDEMPLREARVAFRRRECTISIKQKANKHNNVKDSILNEQQRDNAGDRVKR